ncbi:MAG: YhbY family RNA-binding protein [Tissierellia bacterium]|nr:YhbY family RNA-binding protein [Tissierellia bacterium]
MINSNQRAYLKKLAHGTKPVLNIGKDGVKNETIIALDQALNSRELIKIKILNNNLDDRDQLIDTLLVNLNADFVQYIGNILTIYRPAKEATIVLP